MPVQGQKVSAYREDTFFSRFDLFDDLRTLSLSEQYDGIDECDRQEQDTSGNMQGMYKRDHVKERAGRIWVERQVYPLVSQLLPSLNLEITEQDPQHKREEEAYRSEHFMLLLVGDMRHLQKDTAQQDEESGNFKNAWDHKGSPRSSRSFAHDESAGEAGEDHGNGDQEKPHRKALCTLVIRCIFCRCLHDQSLSMTKAINTTGIYRKEANMSFFALLSERSVAS